MAKNVVVKPLGLVLRKAGLISSKQLEQALQESFKLPQCRLGEILAIRGWIDPQTADFFAEIWPSILLSKEHQQSLDTHSHIPEPSAIQQKKSQPLGQYLKAAKLMDAQQIEAILKIQQGSAAKFGKIAVERGLISQTTLEYFLEHLNLLKAGVDVEAYTHTTALEIDKIETYLSNCKQYQPELLQKYKTIYQQGTAPAIGDDLEQELIASGLIVSKNNVLVLAKPQYRETFDEEWLAKEIARLQPYNEIRFKMFALNDKAHMPYKVNNAINFWCDRQPLLTQKLYQLVKERPTSIPPGEEERVVEELVYQHLVDRWKTGVAAEHFQKICHRIQQNEYCSAKTLLQAYKKIWQLQEVKADGSVPQRELLKIGLLKLRHGRVSPSNRVYHAVFNSYWADRLAENLDTYASRDNFSASSNDIDPDNPSSTDIEERLTKSPKTGRKLFSLFSIFSVLAVILSIPILFKLLTTPQKPQELIEQGDRLSKQQRYQKALTLYQKFLDTQLDKPTDSSSLALAHQLNGKTLLQLKEYSAAASHYREALSFVPKSIEAKQGLGLALSNLGKTAQASKIFEEILQQSDLSQRDRGSTWWYWGNSLCRHGKAELAKYAFNKAFELNGEYEQQIKSATERCSLSLLP